MALIDELLGRIKQSPADRGRSSVHYECRHCGKTVSEEEGVCPVCGSTDIADIPL